MCLATADTMPPLVNSSGAFTDGNFNDICFLASFFAFTTVSEMQRKFIVMGGVAALHLFSYSSKWKLAMWPRQVELDPSRKQLFKVFFERVFEGIPFSSAALDCQVSDCFFCRCN